MIRAWHIPGYLGNASQKLFAMVNQINADSGIRLRSQTFRDLVLGPVCPGVRSTPAFV